MAAKDFTLFSVYAGWAPTKKLAKASSTVIRPWTMVALSSGLAIEATAASAAIAYCEHWAAAGSTELLVINDPNAEYIGTADANFAVTQRATEVDLVVNSGVQEIDVGASSTDVFKVSMGTDAGTVGSEENVKVKINKFIY